MANQDIESMYEAVNELSQCSVSSNASGNSFCTVDDLKRLRDNVVKTLSKIIDHLGD